MKPLFENNASFDLVSLRDLGSRYLVEGTEQIKVIGFQRNAVWKEEKVEALWDSFLSGFPVGSILLARQKDFWDLGFRDAQLNRANPAEDTLIDEHGDGFVVVDGQQRLNGIAQGFMSFDAQKSRSRLWIDLAEPVNSEQRQFEFHLCTAKNPFGVNGPNTLNRDEKRRALESIHRENADDAELNLMDTYPYKARLSVPFYEFWKFIEQLLATGDDLADLENFANVFSKIDWHLSENVMKLIASKFANTKNRNIAKELIEPLKKTVICGNIEDDYKVPVILIQKNDPKRLGKLFERVNINGEVPPQAELFFSALKLRYPLINNYVAHVSNFGNLQGLLRPTEIVLIALRLIDPKITSLDLNRFDRIANENSNKLIELMEQQNNLPSRFTKCLAFIYEALHYSENSNAIGLPRQLISTLRPRVWQTMALWVNANFEKICAGGIQPKDRLNLIRFALLDSLNYFIGWKKGLSAYINAPIFMTLPLKAGIENEHFSAQIIFENVKAKVAQDGYGIQFVTPLAYKTWLDQNTTQTMPNSNQLGNEHCILMYTQRHFLASWEKYHLDIDHIIPSFWMVFRAGPLPERVFWKVQQVDSYLRYRVLNRTGNYRYWPDSLNRAYGDKSPKDKYVRQELNDPTDALHERYGLLTVGDTLAASGIEPEEAKQWEELCSDNPKVWTDDRFASFKQLVTERRYRMYKQMFEAMQWDEWLEAINGN